MPEIVTATREIPTAPYYVLSNDRFLSGWGRARDAVNTIILPCENWTEALIVQENAERRTDQIRVRIVVNKPRLRPGHIYSLCVKETEGRWFQPGSFK